MVECSNDVEIVEKEATDVLLNIFKNVAKFKGISIGNLNSFDDVPLILVDALKDLAQSATDDINNNFINGLGLKTIEDLTSDYSVDYLENLLKSCISCDLKHEYFIYLAGISIIKKYI